MSTQIEPIKTNTYIPKAQNKEGKKEETKDKTVSTKVVLASLAAVGITAAAILAIKNKKKTPPPIKDEIKRITGKNPKIETLTEAEKEKLIKELQSQTDDPDVKAEIRRLIENGEWDKL